MQIRPYPKNAKKHPKDQIEKLARAIEHFGFSPAIELDKDGVIVSGHGRFMAATENLGWTESRVAARANKGELFIPYIVLDDLSDEEIRAKRLADNKLAETDTDMILAVEELRELSLAGFDIELTGFSTDLLVDEEDKDDVVPETPLAPQSKLGDIYILGDHILMCGDSTDPDHVGKLMAGNMSDMVFTDPPYNVNYSGRGVNTGTTIMNDNMDKAAFDTFLKEIFARYHETTKRGAGLYVFHSPTTQEQFANAMRENGFEIKSHMIWNKTVPSMGWGDYRSKHEPFFYAAFKDSKPQFYADRSKVSVFDFHKTEQELITWAKRQKRLEAEGKNTIWTMKREPVGDYKHPTQKPVELVTQAIINSSKQDDIVTDFFAGSGATLIACEKTGRRCYTMELDPRFVDVVVSRYCAFVESNDIIKNGIATTWQTIS